jgi:hypothetical protein
MRNLIILSLISTITACGHNPVQTVSSSYHSKVDSGVKRELASSLPFRKFLEAAFKSSDNAYRSIEEMEKKIIKELQSNPGRYGIQDNIDVRKITKIDDIPSERILAEVLADAPRILKFSKQTQKLAFQAIQGEAGVAARISLGTTDLSHVKLTPADETGLGRRISQQIKHVEADLVARKIASKKEAKEISDALFVSARELSQKAKDDPSLKFVAKQIIEYSTIISQKTGRKFLGQGGCMKINGKDILANKAEIAYRTMKEIDQKVVKNYDELGLILQKNHADVTNRTRKEACQAIRALTVGPSCGNVYARKLAPSGC